MLSEDLEMKAHHKIDYVEFPSADLEKTKAFFSKAFGWQFEDFGPEYTSFGDEGLYGGFYKADSASKPANGAALIVLFSEDLEASQRAVENAGGVIVTESFDFPGGRRFHFTEPMGNEFAIWSEA